MGIVRDLYYARKMSAGLKLPAPTVAQLIKRMFLASTMESGEKATVTGEAPITLTLALAKNLISLTQYGLCSQASTPDPATPVGIKCNNGELKAVDDELPAGYKRVLGFTCNNNAMWEITDFHLKGSDTVRISFSVTAACNVFGCYQGTDATDNYDLYVSTTANSKYLRYGNGTYLSYWSNANLGNRFDVVFGPTGTQGMPDDSTWTEKSFTSANDLLIGSTTTTGTSSKLKGDLYGNIEVDGRLKLIPCERLSDNVLGYYDTYSETFYEPATGFTGAVSLGYDGSHYVLDVVGTPEVLTLTGKNLLNPATNTTGYYISSSGSIASGDDAQYTDLIPVEAGEDYTVSLISNREGGGNNRLHGYDANGDWVQQIVYGNTGTGTGIPWQKTATIPSGIAYVRFSYGIDDDDAMIEKSGTKTTYQPYVAPQTATVENLLSVGDYKDEQEIISGVVKRKVGIKVFDGTESFGKSSAYGAAFYIQSAANVWGAKKEIVMCSHYLGLATASSAAAEDTCFFNASGHFYIRVADNSDTTAFKAWLAAQYAAGTPVIVVYQLAEETTEQVTAQPLHTIEGTNYITVTAEVGPISLAAEYMKELGELKTVSGAMVHITDALAKAATSVLASIEPIQAGSGDPSPDNVRPISGLTGLSVYVSPTQDVADATTYSVDWTTEAGTVYGGTLDVVTGELVVTHAIEDLGNVKWKKDNNRAGVFYGGVTGRETNSYVLACSDYLVLNQSVSTEVDMYISGHFSYGGNTIFVRDTRFSASTAEEYKTGAAGIKAVYKLAAPLTYQLTPQEVQMLLGENYVWSSSGDSVSVTYLSEGNANNRQALRILLGDNYSNPGTPDDASDKEALDILLGR